MRQAIWILILLAYATGIAVTSHQPLGGMATGMLHLDKLFHLLEFAVFMLLAWRAMGKRWWIALAISLAFACSDELHQLFVPGRVASGWDFLADTMGIALAGWMLRSRARLWRFLCTRILSRKRTEGGE